MDSNQQVRYGASSALGRGLLVGFVGVFVLSVIAVWIFAALQNPSGLVVFASFWTVLVAVNAYRLLLRYSYELTLQNQHLEWRGTTSRVGSTGQGSSASRSAGSPTRSIRISRRSNTVTTSAPRLAPPPPRLTVVREGRCGLEQRPPGRGVSERGAVKGKLRFATGP